MEKRPVRLLVVDDSAVMRQAMIAICRRAPEIEVSVAADPLIAQSKMRTSRPDVILLDIEMPRMDGLTFLRKLMADDPLPVVICSALAGRGTETALRALEEGAVEIVAKPRIALHDFLTDSTEMFIDVIRAASAPSGRPACRGARRRPRIAPPPHPRPALSPPQAKRGRPLPLGRAIRRPERRRRDPHRHGRRRRDGSPRDARRRRHHNGPGR